MTTATHWCINVRVQILASVLEVQLIYQYHVIPLIHHKPPQHCVQFVVALLTLLAEWLQSSHLIFTLRSRLRVEASFSLPEGHQDKREGQHQPIVAAVSLS